MVLEGQLPLTCPVSGAFGIVDGVAVVLVEMRLQKGHRERPGKRCQTFTQSRPLPAYNPEHSTPLMLNLMLYKIVIIFNKAYSVNRLMR